MGRIVWYTPPLLAAGVGAAAAPVLLFAGVGLCLAGACGFFLGKRGRK